MKDPGGRCRFVSLYSLLFIVCLTTLTGCDRKQNEDAGDEPVETEKVAALRKEVIAVHDEVMPLINDIYLLKTKLREKLSAENPAAEKKQELEGILVRLDSADRGMRVWMREFSKVKTAGVPEEEAIGKLQNEMEKITKVKKDMIESVQAAKAIE